MIRAAAVGTALSIFTVSAAPPTVQAEGGGGIAVAVRVVRPQRDTIHRRRALPASVEPFEVARLYAKVSGYLGEVRVDIGDVVGKGDVLAVIEVPEMTAEHAQVKAELAEAQAMLGKALANDTLRRAVYERSQALRQRGSVTEQDLEEARAKHMAATAGVALAQAHIGSERARLRRLETMMDYSTIRAPFDGVVTERFVHPGALVQSGTASNNVSPLVTLQRVDTVRAVGAAAEADVPFVDRGDPTALVVRALPDRTFTAPVTRMAQSLEPATRTMRVEVDIANPDGALRPGMYGELIIDLEQESDVLTLPVAALVRDQATTVVYVVEGGTARKVPVTTGADDTRLVAIRSGLSGTEQVIVGGGGALSDGIAVRIIEPGGAAASSPK